MYIWLCSSCSTLQGVNSGPSIGIRKFLASFDMTQWKSSWLMYDDAARTAYTKSAAPSGNTIALTFTASFKFHAAQ